MIKVKYPSNIKTLKDNYVKIFNRSISSMEEKWEPYKNLLGREISLKDLLTGDFQFLVGVYYDYKNIVITEEQETAFNDNFDYDYHHDKIAGFFMDKDNGFDLHTCHYCNMAYINAYGLGMTYRDHLAFVNGASKAEWRAIFKESSLSDAEIDQIIKERPFASLSQFNKKKYLHKKIESYKGMCLNDNANHFDLDHLLPRSKCPILGLSLFNFVPSCQVCNEKLKHDIEIGTNKEEWLKISPTYSKSKLCDDMVIKMIPESSCTTFFDLRKNNGNYQLSFEPRNVKVYDRYIQTFKLQDRYNYHKELALQILDLKERYPEEKRKEISRLLSPSGPERYSELQINEDIFRERISKDRCFSKLRNDMLKHN